MSNYKIISLAVMLVLILSAFGILPKALVLVTRAQIIMVLRLFQPPARMTLGTSTPHLSNLLGWRLSNLGFLTEIEADP
jgi:hypothetical protein